MVGHLTWHDREAEGSAEWLAILRDLIKDRVQGEELGSGRALVGQLDECQLDLGESAAAAASL
jgi:hypothetical protein